MTKRFDLLVAPACEAALILVAGAAAWLLHKPLLFASLGPTAYELVETPERQTAHPYNVILGHLVGVASAFAALLLTHSANAPSPSPAGVPFQRVIAAVIAGALTVLFTLLLNATQPAALSTTLLLALGLMRGWMSAVWIMGAVLLMTAFGEPLRRWRERETGRKEHSPAPQQK